MLTDMGDEPIETSASAEVNADIADGGASGVADAVIVDEVLVEGVSIDGMCGVY